jgi:hypothetical protein
MVGCTPSLFNDLRFAGQPSKGSAGVASLLAAIGGGFATTTARVRRVESVRSLPVQRVLKMWLDEQCTFGITDLHYIGTGFDKIIDTSALNSFNLLPRGTEGFESQDSMVISTKGSVTDSHSDDHSGSNHCFVGHKLWLLWDTLEGIEHGLEDCEHCDVTEKASFNLSEFASMRTSRWILIGPRQTMFIPAHLTHKVVTLEKYIGLGSFHAALPGFPDLLLRWARLRPRWSGHAFGNPHCSVEFLTERVVRKMRALRRASPTERAWWGVPYLQARLKMGQAQHAATRWYESAEANTCSRVFLRAALRL